MREGEPRLVVGVEVHVQLATRTKAFCACPVDFGAPPNTLCCPVCLGHPGALPALNRAALEAAIRTGLALGCVVAPRGRTQWDRKNYFYPDLPKGYQITQYEFPLCENGALVLSDGTRVRIRRAHLEEDTGKSSHAADGATLVDFNRCGVPLLEIVTEPDLGTPEEVEEYLRLLQERLRLAGASDAAMEKGQMRCEPNVNLVRGDGSATAISELKNLNSFAMVREAVAHEAKRLAGGTWHPKGRALPRATYGWDDAGKRTVLQRTKETAADYRYFPEPDLPVLPAEALAGMVEKGRAALGEAEETGAVAKSATEVTTREFGLTTDQARLLIVQDTTHGVFQRTVEEAVALDLGRSLAGAELAKWFIGPLAGCIKDVPGGWPGVHPDVPKELAVALSLQSQGTIGHNVIKQRLFTAAWLRSPEPTPLALRGTPKVHGEFVVQSVDRTTTMRTVAELDADLKAVCQEVVAANADIVAKVKGGKVQARAALVGQVMKKTRGAADPARVNAILDEMIARA